MPLVDFAVAKMPWCKDSIGILWKAHSLVRRKGGASDYANGVCD